MKVHRGSRDISLLYSLTSAQMGMSGQHHAPAALSPEMTRYSLYGRVGGLQGRSQWFWKISPLNRVSIPGQSSSYRVAIPTELSRLTLKHGIMFITLQFYI